MKKIALFAAIVSCTMLCQAQKKHYFSIEQGLTFTGTGSHMKDYMVANNFDATIDFDWGSIFGSPGSVVSSTKYPIQEKKITNYRIRYSYQRNKKTAIEAGIGHLYETLVTGINGNNNSFNRLEITMNISNFYVAYLVKNKTESLAIGIGPTVSFCKIGQQAPYGNNRLQHETQLLPGATFTAYWHFIHQKNWFMGLRTDMAITAPAKIESSTINNSTAPGLVSSTQAGKAGTMMNTISFTAGIKL